MDSVYGNLPPELAGVITHYQVALSQQLCASFTQCELEWLVSTRRHFSVTYSNTDVCRVDCYTTCVRPGVCTLRSFQELYCETGTIDYDDDCNRDVKTASVLRDLRDRFMPFEQVSEIVLCQEDQDSVAVIILLDVVSIFALMHRRLRDIWPDASPEVLLHDARNRTQHFLDCVFTYYICTEQIFALEMYLLTSTACDVGEASFLDGKILLERSRDNCEIYYTALSQHISDAA